MSSLLARDVAQPQPGDSRAEIQAMQSIAEWGPYGYRPQLAGGVVFTIGESHDRHTPTFSDARA